MVQKITPVNTGSVKSSSPGRLREERTRLGLSQTALAESLGVTKWTVINYERPGGRGTPIPADLLSACARLGMDVQYILTGVASTNLNRVAEEAGAYRVERKGPAALSKEEQKLLEKYRRLKPQQRSHAQAIVSTLVSTEGGAGKRKPARRKPRAKR
ncbi:MAG: helix-turn-helix transcriptional regulator [Sulfuricaulis sp.]|uniref:helix-turn-helix transcriptional regulator n=1 Tax=Sulfuricaulis sp. TaxID=2003553 RepID=UPI003C496001